MSEEFDRPYQSQSSRVRVSTAVRCPPTMDICAYHEAGQMAAAGKSRLKICRATIVPSHDFAGNVEHESRLKGINLAGYPPS